MKRILALLLCLPLLAGIAACSPSTQTPEASAQADSRPRISYKGLETRTFTQADMAAAEGREPDFTVEQADTTLYIYNDVELDGLRFTQVQYTYAQSSNRISCTYTADSGLAEMQAQYQTAMTRLYGTPSESGSPVNYRWTDDGGNYVLLTQLNDTTLQLVFYFYREDA